MPANLTPGETLILPDGKYIAVLDNGGTLVFGSLIQRTDGNLTLGYLDPPPSGMTYNPHYFVTRGYTEPHISPAPAPVDPEALTALDLTQPDTSIASEITYYEPKEPPEGFRQNIGPKRTLCYNTTVTALGTGTGGGRGTTTAGGLMMSSANISYIEILGRN